MCDRYLNIAPPEILEFRPLGGLVFMQVTTYTVAQFFGPTTKASSLRTRSRSTPWWRAGVA